MILECDQCHTKFRLDDSKLKPGGVKVRCSKCRHVFLAGAEPRQEESEFDAILSGLGAPVAKQGSETAAPGSTEEPAGFGFGFGAGEDTAAAYAAPPAASVTAEPPAELDKKSAAGPDTADFSAFEFPAEPFESLAQPAAAPGAAEFSASDFELPPTPPQEGQGGGAAQRLEYGEFSFDEEPAPLQEEPPAASAEALDFGEFSFTSEPEPAQEQQAAPALDFGEFEFTAEPAAAPPEESAKAPSSELDFGEFSFNEESAQEEAAAAPEDALDFGAFAFSEEPPVLKEEEAPAAKKEFEFGEFSFEEEPAVAEQAPAAQAPAGQEHDVFSFAAAPQSKEPEAPPATGGSLEFGDFSFPEGTGAPAQASAAAAVASGAAPAGGKLEPGLAPSAPPQQPVGEEPRDFDLGPVPTKVEQFELDEESLPPLSIASRRKGRSVLTVAIVAISVLVIVVLSGAGLYLLQSGPAAFDKVGLGFVAKWFGMESPEEGRITIRNQQASFIQNKEAGELFVVTGEAVNSFRKARASIHVRVSLFDKKGAVLLQKTAYCGNRLSSEQLATLPIAKIESIMNNQFGDSLSNMGVQPGSSIGFVVAMPNVPKEAADFGVEVIGSTVAGK